MEVKNDGTETTANENIYDYKYNEFMNKSFVKESMNKMFNSFDSNDTYEYKLKDSLTESLSFKDIYVIKVKESINKSFSSKIWSKFAPVMTMIYGNRSRDKLDIVDFVDNAVETVYNLCNKLGDVVDRSTIEKVYSDIIIKYYYEMLKNDIDEGYYFDSYSFRALNDFIESLDANDLEILKPLVDKIKTLIKLFYVI